MGAFPQVILSFPHVKQSKIVLQDSDNKDDSSPQRVEPTTNSEIRNMVHLLLVIGIRVSYRGKNKHIESASSDSMPVSRDTIGITKRLLAAFILD